MPPPLSPRISPRGMSPNGRPAPMMDTRWDAAMPDAKAARLRSVKRDIDGNIIEGKDALTGGTVTARSPGNLGNMVPGSAADNSFQSNFTPSAQFLKSFGPPQITQQPTISKAASQAPVAPPAPVTPPAPAATMPVVQTNGSGLPITAAGPSVGVPAGLSKASGGSVGGTVAAPVAAPAPTAPSVAEPPTAAAPAVPPTPQQAGQYNPPPATARSITTPYGPASVRSAQPGQVDNTYLGDQTGDHTADYTAGGQYSSSKSPTAGLTASPDAPTGDAGESQIRRRNAPVQTTATA